MTYSRPRSAPFKTTSLHWLRRTARVFGEASSETRVLGLRPLAGSPLPSASDGTGPAGSTTGPILGPLLGPVLSAESACPAGAPSWAWAEVAEALGGRSLAIISFLTDLRIQSAISAVQSRHLPCRRSAGKYPITVDWRVTMRYARGRCLVPVALHGSLGRSCFWWSTRLTPKRRAWTSGPFSAKRAPAKACSSAIF